LRRAPAARHHPPVALDERETRSTAEIGDLQRICADVASLFRRRWGRGPRQTRAHWAGDDMLVVLMENGHTEAEKSMRAAGHIAELLEGRHLLQGLVEADLCEIVEAATARKLRTSLSATRLDPDLSAEIFLFEPLGEDAAAPPADAARVESAVSASRRLEAETRAVLAQSDQVRRRSERRRSGGDR